MIKYISKFPVIDSIADVKNEVLQEFLTLGLCYVRKSCVPKTEECFVNLKTRAAQFFEQPTEIKSMFKDYNDRRGTKLNECSERLSFPANRPPEPLKAALPDIQRAELELQENIIVPLLNKIFRYLDISATKSCNVVDSDGTYLSFVNYPPRPNNGNDLPIGLRKHKDIGLITVLSLEEPGLKLKDDKQPNTWTDVPPNPEYFVVICGKVLQLILGKDKCYAPSHFVELQQKKRLALGIFFNPGANAPIKNFFTNEQLFENFTPDFVSKTMKKYQ